MNSNNPIRIKCLVSNNDAAQRHTVIVPAGMTNNRSHTVKGKLKFGLKETNVNLMSKPISDIIALSRDIIEEFDISPGLETCIKFENNILSLGPVVGFITGGGTIRKMLDGSPNEKILRTVQAADSAHVSLYFFSINDILWTENAVNGVVYNHAIDAFEDKKMPLPDVIYDRGLAGGLSAGGWRRAMDTRNRLMLIEGIKKINAQHYFDKWDLHCKLSKHDDMTKYLPDTILYKNDIKDLEDMMDKYSTVYIKACVGSNGRSVMRVREASPSIYEYDHFRGELVRKSVDSIDGIPAAADEFMGKKSYIIQQGIDAFTYEGNKVDIRVLTQKNEKGKWKITNMPVRIASNNSPVTSTKSGSAVFNFEEVFLDIIKLQPDEVENLKQDIYKLIRTSVTAIEKEYGTFGELGIDVAIDKNLRVYFLEANSKPAKDTIIKSGSEEDIREAFLPPFEYAKHIAGFH